MTLLEGVLKKSTTTLSAWAGLACCACKAFNPRRKHLSTPAQRHLHAAFAAHQAKRVFLLALSNRPAFCNKRCCPRSEFQARHIESERARMPWRDLVFPVDGRNHVSPQRRVSPAASPIEDTALDTKPAFPGPPKASSAVDSSSRRDD